MSDNGHAEQARDAARLARDLDLIRSRRTTVIITNSMAASIQRALEDAANAHEQLQSAALPDQGDGATDTRRLDWLQERGVLVEMDNDGVQQLNYVVGDVFADDDSKAENELRYTSGQKNIREAIDEAMQSTEPPTP